MCVFIQTLQNISHLYKKIEFTYIDMLHALQMYYQLFVF